MRIFLLVVMVMLVWIDVAGQATSRKDLDKKSLKLYKQASVLSKKRKYKKALSSLDKVLKKYPNFVRAHLKKSGVYYSMQSYENAIKEIDKAIAIDPTYDAEMYFSKGVLYRELKQHDKAAEHLVVYLTKDISDKRRKKASAYLEQSKFIDYALKHPVPFLPQKLKGEVNTNALEYIPALTIDERQMIFTRRVNGQEDLYIATKKDTVFTDVLPLTQLNTPHNEGVHTISADGRRIIFTACQRERQSVGGCDLFTSTIGKDGWTKPRNLGNVINSAAWDAQPSLSADGNQLYWSSTRKGGNGGRDIWMSTRTETSGWHTPMALSNAINSSYDEESPFIHPDGKTLYFRSNRPKGMGGYDIFYSRYDDKGNKWLPAENIGYPINTENDEGALSVSLDGTKAFFATDQATGQNGTAKNLDIFTFELPKEARPLPTTYVKAYVTDRATGKPLIANIDIKTLDGTTETQCTTDENGIYLGSLLAGYEYGFFVEAKGYVYKSAHFDIRDIKSSYDPYTLTIELDKVVEVNTPSEVTNIDEPKPVIMENIFFATGSAELTNRSSLEIEKLYEQLINDRSIKVEIGGHTDNVGSEESNQRLSEQRAKSVVEALVKKGIHSSRLTYKGYGDTMPVDTNDTEEGKQNNRRTEFKIVR